MSTSPKERLETLNDHWWSRGRCAVSLDLLRRHLAHGEAKHALLLGPAADALREKLEPICGEISGPFEENLQKFGVTRDRLPYEDESFDLVCALDVLGEAEDDEAVVSELRRVLSPEGLLLLAVPAHPWLYSDNGSGPHCVDARHAPYYRLHVTLALDGGARRPAARAICVPCAITHTAARVGLGCHA